MGGILWTSGKYVQNKFYDKNCHLCTYGLLYVHIASSHTYVEEGLILKRIPKTNHAYLIQQSKKQYPALVLDVNRAVDSRLYETAEPLFLGQTEMQT